MNYEKIQLEREIIDVVHVGSSYIYQKDEVVYKIKHIKFQEYKHVLKLL
jgi:hypothetical protein